ncbi:SGNH/GDSL hydrolase family protein [Variovorax sp. JS1663]|uniref:SGNH/GDSL hydrolase family protein n=1 Tax=Variovorax sp. JS1663 TaxID=1851577 RepID=UPI000B3428F2|nr:SGNH/GDSL hydrolase family protein [Variovorax sp. JS1663]OUL98304.1 lipase [Variovorax sp. JS1663]
MPSVLRTPWARFAGAAALAAVLSLGAHGAAAGPLATHWAPSWTAAPQPLWQGDFVLPTNVPFQFNRQTLRQVARVSIGGPRLRVEISNEFGTTPLRIGAASVARHREGSAVEAGSERPLRFGGRGEVVLAPGTRAVSDPVDLPVPALGRVAVSLYLPQPTAPSTFHWDAHQTAYVAEGDQTAAARLPANATTLGTRVFLSALMVESPTPPKTVVALGDSLTDGNGSTPDADRRWPDALAERLSGRGVAVLNAGISGGRLLKPGMGLSALARVQRDVLGQPGVRAMVVMLGTNDIGWPGGPFAPQEPPMTAEAMIDGLRQLIAQAHAHNVRIVGGTIAPNENALQGTPIEGHHSPSKDRVRQTVNRWIREGGEFDAVVDFDALLRDPARPSRLLPAYDSGDHLHPGDTGAKAMAQAIDLDALLGERVSQP